MENILDEKEQPQKTKCENLILAAGPFTTWIFKDMFTGSRLHLENHVQGAYWLDVDEDIEKTGTHLSLRFFNQRDRSSKFERDLLVSSRTNHMKACNTLRISGVAAWTEDLVLEPNIALHPRDGKTKDLRKAMSKYLSTDHFDINSEPRQAKGCCELSTANDGNPIVDRVPAAALGIQCDEGRQAVPGGTWLCYGFGRQVPRAVMVLRAMIAWMDSNSASHLVHIQITR